MTNISILNWWIIETYYVQKVAAWSIKARKWSKDYYWLESANLPTKVAYFSSSLFSLMKVVKFNSTKCWWEMKTKPTTVMHSRWMDRKGWNSEPVGRACFPGIDSWCYQARLPKKCLHSSVKRGTSRSLWKMEIKLSFFWWKAS